MDKHVEPEMSSTGNTRTSKRQDRRKRIYIDDDPLANNFENTCQHTQNSKFQCRKFTKHDVVENRQSLYKTDNKISQEIFLTSLIRVSEPLRHRYNNNHTQNLKPKCVSSTLTLMKEGQSEIVCKTLFMNALSVSKRRLEFLLKRIFDGELPSERRGGKRRNKDRDPIHIDEHTALDNKYEMALLCKKIELNVR